MLKSHHHFFLWNLGPCKAAPDQHLLSMLPLLIRGWAPVLGVLCGQQVLLAFSSFSGLWAFAWVWPIHRTCLFFCPHLPSLRDQIPSSGVTQAPSACLSHGGMYISVVRWPDSAALYHPLDCGLPLQTSSLLNFHRTLWSIGNPNTAFCGLLLQHSPGTIFHNPSHGLSEKYRTWGSQGFGDWLLQSNPPCFRERGSL